MNPSAGTPNSDSSTAPSAPSPNRDSHAPATVILGGGPCGLMAAWELARAGQPVIVLEAGEEPGGLCITVEREGWKFDLGGHRFIARNPDLVERILGLMGDEMLRSTRKSVILTEGQAFEYPLSARDVLKKVDPAYAARAVADYLLEATRQRLAPRPDVSFEDWVVHRFGRTLYVTFFGRYTEKLWGIPPSRLSSDWAAQRISLLNLSDVGWRLLGMKKGTPRTYALEYLYPKEGFGRLFTRMAEEITGLGGEIRCGSFAQEITLGNGQATAVRYRRGDRMETIPCSHVVSTIPLPGLLRAIGRMTPEVETHAASLKHRGLRFMNLLLDLPDVSENTWMYVPDPQYLMTRIQEPRRRSPFMAPPGKTSLMLEIPCDPGTPVWEMPDEPLRDRCLDDLNALGIDVRDKVLGCFSTRAAHAYPIYHLGYAESVRRLLDEVDRIPNLFTAGRQGLFRYIFTDTAMEMGLLAARACMGEARRESVFELDCQPGVLETYSIV
ncbi:MAG: FAD-dependent oxidoreductase [Armatimonadetes bacterium]|nr:FAD-dependent oxidoreductase [Armatimonadota bacterium]